MAMVVNSRTVDLYVRKLFRELWWSEVRVGQVVYLHSGAMPSEFASGPFTVLDPAAKIFRNQNGDRLDMGRFAHIRPLVLVEEDVP